MLTQASQPATNARILGVLEDVIAELARASARQERIERELARLLERD
jgi:hypothetical protein